VGPPPPPLLKLPLPTLHRSPSFFCDDFRLPTLNITRLTGSQTEPCLALFGLTFEWRYWIFTPLSEVRPPDFFFPLGFFVSPPLPFPDVKVNISVPLELWPLDHFLGRTLPSPSLTPSPFSVLFFCFFSSTPKKNFLLQSVDPVPSERTTLYSSWSPRSLTPPPPPFSPIPLAIPSKEVVSLDTNLGENSLLSTPTLPLFLFPLFLCNGC